MLICAICGYRYAPSPHCEDTHPEVCHSCGELSCRHSLGYYEHPDPEGLAGLTAREREAVAAYEAHVQRTVGGGPLGVLVTPDTEQP